MMNEIKRALKLLRYAYGLKMNLGVGIFFIIFGLVAECVPSNGTLNYMGGFYMTLSGMMLVQLWYTLNNSNFLQASPFHRIAHVHVPTILMTTMDLLMFTVVLFFNLLQKRNYASPPLFGKSIVLFAVSIFVVMLYAGIAYKAFVAGTILFIIAFVPLMKKGIDFMMAAMGEERIVTDGWYLSIPGSILVSYLIIFAGAALLYVLNCLLYKKSVSKWSQGAILRKYL